MPRKVLAHTKTQGTNTLQEDIEKKKKKKATKALTSTVSNSKKEIIWHHEWTLPELLANDEKFDIHEIVHGPFFSPKLVKASPCIINHRHLDKNGRDKKIVGIRFGIPDPWNEYLALRGFSSECDRKIAKRRLKLGCNTVLFTEAVWKDLGLTLSQGIPDPWKNCQCVTKSEVKEQKSSSQSGKTRIKLWETSEGFKDRPKLSKKLENKLSASKTEKMSCTEDSKILEKQGSAKKKIFNPENLQTVLFEGTTIVEDSSKCLQHGSLTKKRSRFLQETQRRGTNRHRSNNFKCDINYRRLNFTNENMKNDTKIPHDDGKTYRHCHVCQPEVMPTRCSNAARMEQENFWRCRRHQPGSSYRLEASQFSRRKMENLESLNSMRIEPEKVCRVSAENSQNFDNEKTVTGMMARLLRGWKDKNDEKGKKKLVLGVEKDAKIPDINLVCCRCSCPYLRTTNRLDYENNDYQKFVKKQPCEKCVCPKCLKRREHRIIDRKGKMCPKHGRRLKKHCKRKMERFSVCAVENSQSVPSTRICKGFEETPEKDRTIGKYTERYSAVSKVGAEMSDEEKSPFPEVTDCRIRRFAKKISSDSGAQDADVSDASRRNNHVEVSSVTSTTFIHMIGGRNTKNKFPKSLQTDFHCSDNERSHIGRRGKRRLAKRSRENNLRPYPDYPDKNSAFKQIGVPIVEQKRVTYEIERSPRVEKNLIISDSPKNSKKEVLSNSKLPEKNKGSRTKINDLEENLLRLTSPRASDAEKSRPTSMTDDRKINYENDACNQSSDQSSPRKRRVTNVTAQGISSSKLMDPPRIAAKIEKVKNQSEINQDEASESKMRHFGTDMTGISLDPGPCILNKRGDDNDFSYETSIETFEKICQEGNGSDDSEFEIHDHDKMASFCDQENGRPTISAPTSGRCTTKNGFFPDETNESPNCDVNNFTDIDVNETRLEQELII